MHYTPLLVIDNLSPSSSFSMSKAPLIGSTFLFLRLFHLLRKKKDGSREGDHASGHMAMTDEGMALISIDDIVPVHCVFNLWALTFTQDVNPNDHNTLFPYFLVCQVSLARAKGESAMEAKLKPPTCTWFPCTSKPQPSFPVKQRVSSYPGPLNFYKYHRLFLHCSPTF